MWLGGPELDAATVGHDDPLLCLAVGDCPAQWPEELGQLVPRILEQLVVGCTPAYGVTTEGCLCCQVDAEA